MNKLDIKCFMIKTRTKLVSKAEDAVRNIESFQEEIANSEGLQQRAAYARAWYAIEVNGRHIFGPSKFIGYSGMTADEYLEPESDRDGRKTETSLQQWFELASDDLQEVLHEELADWLATYGVSPSRACRINILRDSASQTENRGNGTNQLLELLVAVARSLPTDQRQQLRNRI